MSDLKLYFVRTGLLTFSFFRTNDNHEPVDMDEDNFSLSSMEDLPESDSVPAPKKDDNLISIEQILLNPERKRRPRK